MCPIIKSLTPVLYSVFVKYKYSLVFLSQFECKLANKYNQYVQFRNVCTAVYQWSLLWTRKTNHCLLSLVFFHHFCFRFSNLENFLFVWMGRGGVLHMMSHVHSIEAELKADLSGVTDIVVLPPYRYEWSSMP